MNISEAVVSELVTLLKTNTQLQEFKTLLELAERVGLVVRGSLQKQEATGQGLLPYADALLRGAAQVKVLSLSLLDITLTELQAQQLFELGFETAMAKAGDPYDPITADIRIDVGDFPGTDEED